MNTLKRDYIWLGIVLIILLVIVLNIPKETERLNRITEPAIEPAAQPYSVISTKDISTVDRSRYEFRILAPTATTFESRALITMKAAEDLRQEKMSQVTRVFLEPDYKSSGQGLALAIAVYAIDGKGFSGVEGRKWEVEATGEKPSQNIPTRATFKVE